MNSILDNHSALNNYKTTNGISISCTVASDYKKHTTFLKVVNNFGIVIKNDLKKYLSNEMELDKAWQSWIRFHENVKALKLTEEVINSAQNAYVKNGIEGMLNFIYYRIRKKENND